MKYYNEYLTVKDLIQMLEKYPEDTQIFEFKKEELTNVVEPYAIVDKETYSFKINKVKNIPFAYSANSTGGCCL